MRIDSKMKQKSHLRNLLAKAIEVGDKNESVGDIGGFLVPSLGGD